MFLVCINNVKDRFAHHIHILYDHNFHRFFLLNGWNVFNPSIAFRTERIDSINSAHRSLRLHRAPCKVKTRNLTEHVELGRHSDIYSSSFFLSSVVPSFIFDVMPFDTSGIFFFCSFPSNTASRSTSYVL